MDLQFNTNVYHFTSEVMAILLEQFNGKVAGSEEVNMDLIMRELFGDFKPSKINDNYLKRFITNNNMENGNMICDNKKKIDDVWHPWTEKSSKIPFKEESKGIGNGEKKLSLELELDIENVGGQNSIADLKSKEYGDISVKDMTNDDCRIGVECTTEMNKIFKKIVIPFDTWLDKYKETCPIVEEIYKIFNMKYGKSRTTISEGIDRKELSQTNLTKLNETINVSKNKYLKKEFNGKALTSEYITDVVKNLGNNQLKDILDDCIRKEAIDMKLIIVDKNKGWFPVNDLSKLSCPRITSGAPRINYNW